VPVLIVLDREESNENRIITFATESVDVGAGLNSTLITRML
jgi:hypothetical protein